MLWYRKANYASSDQFWVWEKVQAQDLVALPRLQMHSKWLALLLQPLTVKPAETVENIKGKG